MSPGRSYALDPPMSGTCMPPRVPVAEMMEWPVGILNTNVASVPRQIGFGLVVNGGNVGVPAQIVLLGPATTPHAEVNETDNVPYPFPVLLIVTVLEVLEPEIEKLPLAVQIGENPAGTPTE